MTFLPKTASNIQSGIWCPLSFMYKTQRCAVSTQRPKQVDLVHAQPHKYSGAVKPLLSSPHLHTYVYVSSVCIDMEMAMSGCSCFSGEDMIREITEVTMQMIKSETSSLGEKESSILYLISNWLIRNGFFLYTIAHPDAQYTLLTWTQNVDQHHMWLPICPLFLKIIHGCHCICWRRPAEAQYLLPKEGRGWGEWKDGWSTRWREHKGGNLSASLQIWQPIRAAVEPGGEEGGMPTELQNPCKWKHDSVINYFALFSGLTKGE